MPRGDEALLHTATVRALLPSGLLQLAAADYGRVAREAQQQEAHERMEFVRSVGPFKHMRDEQLARLCGLLKAQTFPVGGVVQRQIVRFDFLVKLFFFFFLTKYHVGQKFSVKRFGS